MRTASITAGIFLASQMLAPLAAARQGNDAAAAKQNLARRLVATLDLHAYHRDAAKGFAELGAVAVPLLTETLLRGSRVEAIGAAFGLMAIPGQGEKAVALLDSAFAGHRRDLLIGGPGSPTLGAAWIPYLHQQLPNNRKAIEILLVKLDEPSGERLAYMLGRHTRSKGMIVTLAREIYSGDQTRVARAVKVVCAAGGSRMRGGVPDGVAEAVQQFFSGKPGAEDKLEGLVKSSKSRARFVTRRVLQACTDIARQREAIGKARDPAAANAQPLEPAAIGGPPPIRKAPPDATAAQHCQRLIDMLDLTALRDRAIRELAATGAPSVSAIEKAFIHRNPLIAEGAVRAFATMKSPPTAPAETLLRLAQDQRVTERARVACLGFLAGIESHRREVLNVFEVLLGGSSIPIVRKVVRLLGPLGHQGDDRVVMILLRALRHESPEIQIAAIHALSMNKARTQLERLAKKPGLALPVKQVLDTVLSTQPRKLVGFLVADYSDNRMLRIDLQGDTVMTMEEVFGVWDATFLPNGNYLITEFSVNRVREVTPDGKIVWQYTNLKNPYSAQRLPNGNTLIADTFGRRVIEVDKAGGTVWKYDSAIHPYDAERLPNGNTLIADTRGKRVIEVDQAGRIVWQVNNVPNVHDADRLPNGNTLLTIRTLNEVREVDPRGETVWRLGNLSSPSDADRLPDGRTVVAENGSIRIFDADGTEAWKMAITWAVEVNPIWQSTVDAAAKAKAGK